MRLMTVKYFCLLLFSSILALPIYAQDSAVVRGVVADEKNTPIDLVNIVVKEDQRYGTTTNTNGYYQMKVPTGRAITLIYSYLNKPLYSKTLTLKKGEISQVSFQVQSSIIELKAVEVTDQSTREIPSLSEVKVKEILLPDAGGGGIEAYLAPQVLGMNKSNELSSNYSVRGGNYDENLVYVNDFEIYRPYLVRSGQQEGLSFPNPSLISNIKFSSGGWQAKYGDKLSSVMDVTYKRPKGWGGSFTASLLGLSAHIEGCTKDPRRFSFVLGVRQKTSQYILGGLDTKGEYSPNFIDAQLFATAQLTEKWSMEIISNVARNQFDFVPNTRQANYGTVTDTKGVLVAFEGQESDRYLSLMNGLAAIYSPKKNLKIKFLGSVYNSWEKENYDIISQYFIGDVQTDPSKSDYGKVSNYQGIGASHDWARNSLRTDVYALSHRGAWDVSTHHILWGIDYKHEVIHDNLYEWQRLDSAGYSLHYIDGQPKGFYGDSTPAGNNAQIQFWHILAPTPFNLSSNRISAFIQDNIRFGKHDNLTFTYGLRFQYWDVNKEAVITPRVQFSVKPKLNKDFIITTGAGLYYQPPFYREMRDTGGVVHLDLKSQKSFHAVLGFNYGFTAWHRPFSFVTEVYYKFLWDIVPFEYDNTLIRYAGNNNGRGYTTGIDFRLNGELAEGAESYLSLSLMHTENQVGGARRVAYYDSAGNEIKFRTAETILKIVKTDTIAVGWQPRPTDQLVTFNLFFSDYIPKWPFIKFNLNLVFGSGIPTISPGSPAYRFDTRLPFYRRADMGFAFRLWDPKWSKSKSKTSQAFRSVWLSFDVVNIFGINNTVSYTYVKDINVNQYPVPNFLVGRRLNVKLVFNFGKA